MAWRFTNKRDRELLSGKAVNMAMSTISQVLAFFESDFGPDDLSQAANFLEEIKNELNAAIDAKITELQGKGRKKA